MSNAQSNPVIRRPNAELDTRDIAIDQPPVISSREDLESEVVISPAALERDYADALKMAEDPVTIRIEPTGGKFAPPVTDCWVNGRGAEIVVGGRWLIANCIPVGVPVTTKRKYAEVLLRSKLTSVSTRVDTDQNGDVNELDRRVTSVSPLQIIEDKNPKGGEWLRRLVRQG